MELFFHLKSRGMRRAIVLACILFPAFVCNGLDGADAREPLKPSVQYDASVDVEEINAFIKANCYVESVSNKAPMGLVLKRSCTGNLDSTGHMTFHVQAGYGHSDSSNGFTIITATEDFDIDVKGLEPLPSISPDNPPGEGGITFFCRNAGECDSVSYTFYSDDGTAPVASGTDCRGCDGWSIPIGAPQSQLVQGLFRPLERIIEPDHHDTITCENFSCAN